MQVSPCIHPHHVITLAEILITLGIVGVVASLTLPTLVSNTGNASIGPKLAKSVSVFERANQSLLFDMQSSSLTGTGLVRAANWNVRNYFTALENYIKGTTVDLSDITDPTWEQIAQEVPLLRNGGVCRPASIDYFSTRFITKDGIEYLAVPLENLPPDQPAHKQQLGSVIIDLNGLGTAPNEPGTDLFSFAWYNDGSLRPAGARGWSVNTDGETGEAGCSWRALCKSGKTPGNGFACTGSIFENDLKVMYN